MESIFYDPLTIDLSFQSRLFDIKILDSKKIYELFYVTNLLKFSKIEKCFMENL